MEKLGMLTLVAFIIMSANLANAQLCPGDLNGDHQVTIDEVLTVVNAALNQCPVSPSRFVDNGDGTITDLQTSLMWEKKRNYDGQPNKSDPSDADNFYTWWDETSESVLLNGSAVTDFLARLNDCTTPDGTHVYGGLANHCDWRLPTIVELRTLIDSAAPTCGTTGGRCIHPIFTPTDAFYWSSTRAAPGGPGYARGVGFLDGSTVVGNTTDEFAVRAVRRLTPE